jgi:MinD superfamily P-loop ATPase
MAKPVRLHIDYERCHSCKACLVTRSCRLKAVVQVDPGEPPYLDIERCLDCQICIPACPFKAVVSEVGR